MGLFEERKIRKINKLKSAQDPEEEIEKYLHHDKWNVVSEAIGALEFIGSERATDLLIAHFKQLGTFNTSDAERIIKALEKIDSPKSIGFIRQVYLDNKNNRSNRYSDFARKVLNKKGSPVVILDQISELDDKKIYNKTVSDKSIQTLCDKIRKHISRENHLIKIVSETKIPEFAREALKKIGELDKIAIADLKKMIRNEVASEEVLDRISDPGIILHTIEDEEIYLTCGATVLDLVLNRLDQQGVKVKTKDKQIDCQYCEGTGEYVVYERMTEDQIYYGEKPQITGTYPCDKCVGTGKLTHREVVVKYLDKQVFLYVTLNKDQLILEIHK